MKVDRIGARLAAHAIDTVQKIVRMTMDPVRYAWWIDIGPAACDGEAFVADSHKFQNLHRTILDVAYQAIDAP